MKHGSGIYIWGKSGNKYEGDFKYDKRHGYGTYTWLDGTKYEGYWEKDQMHGKGKMIYPEGEKQVGQYVHGKFTGQKYKPVDKRKQILKILKRISSSETQTRSKRKVLAVGGDHLMFNSKSKGFKSKKKGSKHRLTASIDYSQNEDSILREHKI